MAEKNQGQSGRGAPRHGGGGGGGGGPMGARLRREKPKDAKKILRRLTGYLGRNAALLVGLLLIILIVTALSVAGPSILGKAIDAIRIKESDWANLNVKIDRRQLYTMLGLLAGVYGLSAVLTYFQGILSAKLSLFTVKTLRSDLFAKIVRLPLKYTDSHRHGDLISRMTNDAENISNTISSSLASLISGGLTLAGTLAVMLVYSPLLTAVSLVTVPLTLLLSGSMAKRMRSLFHKQQELLGSLNGQIEEMVTGRKTVVAYGHERAAVGNFSKTSDQYRKTSIRARIFGGIMGPAMNLISNLGFLLIAAVGGYMALNDAISIGTIQAFVIYARQLTRPINELANQYAQIQTALTGAERVFEIMDEAPEENSGRVIPETTGGGLEFRDVVFSYKEGEPVLKGLNLTVRPGSKIAVVGATGAGKTTIVNLLTRFYEIDSGEILLDGVDIRNIEKEALRRSIAIVLQDTVLFSDTIAYNIRYGRIGADMDSVRSAAELSNAENFIDALPEGYDTVLTETGGNLSGGQRQLLSIARAVLADPKILILDEATSSVDTRTEMHIQEGMIALMKNRTSLIIAHRLSTIRDADMIAVIDGGVVAEAGSHEELMEKKGAYYSLYQRQYAGIET